MLWIDALNAVIDDGIEAARLDYARPDQKLKLDGSIRGFEDCRGKTAEEIGKLLAQANQDADDARRREAQDYWHWRCRAAEIEWVANVLSAILMNEGRPTIVTPTARGMLKAADIIGVSERPRDPS